MLGLEDLDENGLNKHEDNPLNKHVTKLNNGNIQYLYQGGEIHNIIQEHILQNIWSVWSQIAFGFR